MKIPIRGVMGALEWNSKFWHELRFTWSPMRIICKQITTMRASRFLVALAAAGLLLSVGCAGPERKLGRGINNLTEPIRMGELRRSMEQTALWDNNDSAYTTGFFRGVGRTFQR